MYNIILLDQLRIDNCAVLRTAISLVLQPPGVDYFCAPLVAHRAAMRPYLILPQPGTKKDPHAEHVGRLGELLVYHQQE